MPKIDIAGLPVDTVNRYPDPFWRAVVGRERKRLGNAVGLSQFGVNLTTLKPGAWSSQRHWHENEDEFVYVVAGELVLCEDKGETVLKPGDAAGFPANSGNGHCLINRTDHDAVYIEVGTRAKSERTPYSDIDMRYERDEQGNVHYVHKSGEPYPKRQGT
jgi:uncharacterized cupin superfamily protein